MKIAPNHSLTDFDILVNEDGDVMIALDALDAAPSDQVTLHINPETSEFILERNQDDTHLIQGLKSEELINRIKEAASVLFIETSGKDVVYEYRAITSTY